jgi:hypothetical protein
MQSIAYVGDVSAVTAVQLPSGRELLLSGE